MLALLADQLALGQKLAQIVANPALDDLPESLVILFNLENHCGLLPNSALSALS
jgi:hypothetical protein